MRPAIDIMTAIRGVRISGTKEAVRASAVIYNYFKKCNISVKKETFSHFISDTQESTIKAGKIVIKGIPYGLTVPYKIKGELLCIDSISSLLNISADVKNKIVLTRERPKPAQYKKLKSKGLKGIISVSRFDGNISSLHLSEWMIKEKCIIPAIDISFDDAVKLRKKVQTIVSISGKGKTGKIKAANIIADIKGTNKTDETLLITAHYDSVPFSPGASDNAGGIGAIYELIKIFSEKPAKRNLRFIAFSGEEWGLWGSRYYFHSHYNEMKNIIGGINVDVAGDVLGLNYCKVTGNDRLLHTVNNIADISGLSMNISKDIYSSDNMPFNHNGIPFINVFRGGGKPSVYIHTKNDTMEHIIEESFDDIIDFCSLFIDKTGNAERNIIDRHIDDDTVKKIDSYFKMRGIPKEHITDSLPFAKKKAGK